MITVAEALQLIETQYRDFGTESIPLHQSVGRILREDLYADRDFPPYNRVTMDGICLQRQAFVDGRRAFKIAGIAAAGSPQTTLRDGAHCMEVMTGSILPLQADVVVRYEDLEIKDGVAKVNLDALGFRQNIHEQGEDREKGSLVISKGRAISPAEIGVAATVGKAEILVSRLPKVLVISTGDELVDVHEQPEAHQIRRSNIYRLQTTLHHYGIQAHTAHLDDDLPAIKNALQDFIQQFEVIILSGGVSKGKFDFLPEALEATGVQKLFHKIKQRPGKPFWFGYHPQGPVVFALPGNPVSSFMCTHRYFIPWLKASLSIEAEPFPLACLEEDIPFKPDLTYFAQVKLRYSEKGTLLAKAIRGNGSGDLANLVDNDAFIALPRGKNLYKKGEVYPVIIYR